MTGTLFDLKKIVEGPLVKVWFKGTISEGVDLVKLVGFSGTELHVNCREVERLNSAGIRNWCLFFDGLRRKGVKLKFLECSPAVSEQCNYIANFMDRGEVESLCINFLCPECHSASQKIESVKTLVSSNCQAPMENCNQCGKKMELDQLALDYVISLS